MDSADQSIQPDPNRESAPNIVQGPYYGLKRSERDAYFCLLLLILTAILLGQWGYYAGLRSFELVPYLIETAFGGCAIGWLLDELLACVYTDRRGVYIRRLFYWDLWSWDAFSEGRIYLDSDEQRIFIDPCKSWPCHKLDLSVLSEKAKQAVLELIYQHWRTEFTSPLSMIVIRSHWPFRETICFDRSYFSVSRNGMRREFDWLDLRRAMIRMGRFDGHVSRIQLFFPDFKISIDRDRTGQEALDDLGLFLRSHPQPLPLQFRLPFTVSRTNAEARLASLWTPFQTGLIAFFGTLLVCPVVIIPGGLVLKQFTAWNSDLPAVVALSVLSAVTITAVCLSLLGDFRKDLREELALWVEYEQRLTATTELAEGGSGQNTAPELPAAGTQNSPDQTTLPDGETRCRAISVDT